MIERLEGASPKRVFVVGADLHRAAKELAELWDGEFRSLLTFVVPDSLEAQSVIPSYFEPVADLSSISLVLTDLSAFIQETVRRGVELLPDFKIVVRVRNLAGDIRDVDITDAELAEQPLLDKFDIVKSKDLRRLTETDLTLEDFNAFFDRSLHSWRAFAAGLPWIPDRGAIDAVQRSLATAHKRDTDQVSILSIVSEAGAGGTTLGRSIAFAAASAGFPTLLAKPHVYEPNATEVTTFLHRALTSARAGAAAVDGNDSNGDEPETPWLLVFDREQWDGQEHAIGHFAAEIARSGRPAVILKVLGPDISPEVLSLSTKELCALTHELDRLQVRALGEHLNRYLKPLGRSKGEADWLRFWEQHKPDIDTSIAAFWVILEFWLKGLLDLGESIQGWLFKQYREAPLTPDLRRSLLEIAALGIERRAVPEQLLPLPRDTKLPVSVALEQLRTSIPGLALVRQESDIGRFWAVAHDVLGRYLYD